MRLKFQFGNYQWALSAGGPPMGSKERAGVSLLEALRAAHPALLNLTDREIASWIVARLNFITGGSLEFEGTSFSADDDQFGYKIRLSDETGTTLAHAAVVFQPERVFFASLDIKVPDFQALFVKLLADSPTDLARCEIIVCQPETKRKRSYGWDGYALLKR